LSEEQLGDTSSGPVSGKICLNSGQLLEDLLEKELERPFDDLLEQSEDLFEELLEHSLSYNNERRAK